MTDRDVALMAHLLRRAGFGATRDELEAYLDVGYEAAVEDLLSPGDSGRMPDDVIRRYHVDQSELRLLDSMAAEWLYRMISTRCPLEEKITLFWHGLFATAEIKVFQGKTLKSQIDMFRRHGLGSFRDLLTQLSRDPAMIYWLDNHDNHSGAVNENYGRELLELFSMGIGSYSEKDVYECARAFTGWTIQNAGYMALRVDNASIWPYGKIAWQFEYDAADHDDAEKSFLGETGRFGGEDIIEIIVRNPATARFVGRRLYQFFVSEQIDERGEALIQTLADAYVHSNYEIRSVLRTLFTSEHFKSEAVRYAHYKSPAELVVGTLRLAQAFRWPELQIRDAALAMGYMGQELLNPPSVEGWHEGPEWIDSGTLLERVNFAVRYLDDEESPGVRSITDRLAAMGDGALTAEQVVDACLNLMGPLEVAGPTREALVSGVAHDGELDLNNSARREESRRRVAHLLGLMASTKEYQMA
jgi:uncharacterized protein (DUF1800 family)